MPEIQVTDDQLERLDALRTELADEMVGKYGHVRRRDALEYLLDQHGEGGGDEPATTPAGPGANGAEPDADGDGDAATASSEGDDGADADDESGARDAADGGGGDEDGGAMLDAMMNLMSAHEDKWREASGGDARYEVDLPDGSTGEARTKDDVRALLFEHYR
jgi:hypothetical protein